MNILTRNILKNAKYLMKDISKGNKPKFYQHSVVREHPVTGQAGLFDYWYEVRNDLWSNYYTMVGIDFEDDIIKNINQRSNGFHNSGIAPATFATVYAVLTDNEMYPSQNLAHGLYISLAEFRSRQYGINTKFSELVDSHVYNPNLAMRVIKAAKFLEKQGSHNND